MKFTVLTLAVASSLILASTVNSQVVEIPLKNSQPSPLKLTYGPGSGLFYDGQYVYSVTDRGPSVDCEDSEAILGEAYPCGEGKVFPEPNYQPTLFKWRLQGEYIFLDQKIPLSTSGLPLNGRYLPLSDYLAFPVVDLYKEQVQTSVDGIDPEALVKVGNYFYIADEFGPSILQATMDGDVLVRWIPKGMTDQFIESTIPIEERLPAILAKRQTNRGIEAMAISPDQRTLYIMMQSPLANPNKKAYKKSRNIRLFTFAIDKMNDLGDVLSEHVYLLDKPETFARGDKGDPGKKQKNVKMSEMMATQDGLFVLERITNTTKAYRINLQEATDIYLSSFDDEMTEPSLEQINNLTDENITPVTKQLIWNTLDDNKIWPSKIEGMTAITPNKWLLVNDSDFTIYGKKTEFKILNFNK